MSQNFIKNGNTIEVYDGEEITGIIQEITDVKTNSSFEGNGTPLSLLSLANPTVQQADLTLNNIDFIAWINDSQAGRVQNTDQYSITMSKIDNIVESAATYISYTNPPFIDLQSVASGSILTVNATITWDGPIPVDIHTMNGTAYFALTTQANRTFKNIATSNVEWADKSIFINFEEVIVGADQRLGIKFLGINFPRWTNTALYQLQFYLVKNPNITIQKPAKLKRRLANEKA